MAPPALPKLRRLHDRVLLKMTAGPHTPARLIFDLDSTVLVVYGKQEEARVGYNPIKRGRVANEAYFHLLLLAYNLVNWFKRLCLSEDFQTATLQTLRNRILLMPAQLSGQATDLALSCQPAVHARPPGDTPC